MKTTKNDPDLLEKCDFAGGVRGKCTSLSGGYQRRGDRSGCSDKYVQTPVYEYAYVDTARYPEMTTFAAATDSCRYASPINRSLVVSVLRQPRPVFGADHLREFGHQRR